MDFERLRKEALIWMRDPNDKRTMEDLIMQYGSKELLIEYKKPNFMQGG